MRSPRRLVVNRGDEVEKVSKVSPCKILDECGTCPKLAIQYRDQLQQKTDSLKNLLRLQGDAFATIPVKDCVASPHALAYRHTAKLVIGQERKRGMSQPWIKIGLYRPGSHELIDIGGCPVQDFAINKIIAYLRGAIRQFDLPIYDEKTKKGLLRFVVIRSTANSKEQLVTFVTHEKGERTQLRTMARDLVSKFTSVQGIMQHINSEGGNAIFSSQGDESTVTLVGTPVLNEELAGLKLQVSSTSFFQTNPAVAEQMYLRMADIAGLQRHETALDLYCGVGGITLSLAKTAGRVVGIDESGSSIKDAAKNAGLNKMSNVQFHQGKTEVVLPQLIESKSLGAVSVVTVNPSRAGCEASVVKNIAGLAPRGILYMSCYPETLVRDLKLFAELKYKCVVLEPFDMFPGTNHYEVLAYLVPQT